eukprot:512979-Amphidinium_carterae.1
MTTMTTMMMVTMLTKRKARRRRRRTTMTKQRVCSKRGFESIDPSVWMVTLRRGTICVREVVVVARGWCFNNHTIRCLRFCLLHRKEDAIAPVNRCGG